MQPLAFYQQPFLESDRISQRKAAEQLAAIEIHGFGQALQAGAAQMQVPMRVRSDGSQQRLKARHIHMDQRRIEGHILSGNREQLRAETRLVRVEGLAEPMQRLAQIVRRLLIAPLRPEQRRQRLPAAGTARLQAEVGEQRADLIGAEIPHRRAFQRRLEYAEQG